MIAAVPKGSWHKKVDRRKLNKHYLGKVVAVDVAGCYLSDPETPAPEVVIKLWVGVMSMEFEAAVSFEESSSENLNFGEGVIPYAEALVRVADDQFAFTTAESGGGGEGIFRRMAAVETGLSELKELLRENLKGKAKEAPSGSVGAETPGTKAAKAKAVRGARPEGAPKAKASFFRPDGQGNGVSRRWPG